MDNQWRIKGGGGHVPPKSSRVIFYSVCCSGVWKDCNVSLYGRWGKTMKDDKIVACFESAMTKTGHNIPNEYPGSTCVDK